MKLQVSVLLLLIGSICAQERSISGSSSRRNRFSAGKSQAINFNCPEDFGYYSHPHDCSQYYVCVFGGALLESCTGGLQYSNDLQTCDWPRNVVCNPSSGPGISTVKVTDPRTQGRDLNRIHPATESLTSSSHLSRGVDNSIRSSRQPVKSSGTSKSIFDDSTNRQARFLVNQDADPQRIIDNRFQAQETSSRTFNVVPSSSPKSKLSFPPSLPVPSNSNRFTPARATTPAPLADKSFYSDLLNSNDTDYYYYYDDFLYDDYFDSAPPVTTTASPRVRTPSRSRGKQEPKKSASPSVLVSGNSRRGGSSRTSSSNLSRSRPSSSLTSSPSISSFPNAFTTSSRSSGGRGGSAPLKKGQTSQRSSSRSSSSRLATNRHQPHNQTVQSPSTSTLSPPTTTFSPSSSTFSQNASLTDLNNDISSNSISEKDAIPSPSGPVPSIVFLPTDEKRKPVSGNKIDIEKSEKNASKADKLTFTEHEPQDEENEVESFGGSKKDKSKPIQISTITVALLKERNINLGQNLKSQKLAATGISKNKSDLVQPAPIPKTETSSGSQNSSTSQSRPENLGTSKDKMSDEQHPKEDIFETIIKSSQRKLNRKTSRRSNSQRETMNVRNIRRRENSPLSRGPSINLRPGITLNQRRQNVRNINNSRFDRTQSSQNLRTNSRSTPINTFFGSSNPQSKRPLGESVRNLGTSVRNPVSTLSKKDSRTSSPRIIVPPSPKRILLREPPATKLPQRSQPIKNNHNTATNIQIDRSNNRENSQSTLNKNSDPATLSISLPPRSADTRSSISSSRSNPTAPLSSASVNHSTKVASKLTSTGSLSQRQSPQISMRSNTSPSARPGISTNGNIRSQLTSSNTRHNSDSLKHSMRNNNESTTSVRTLSSFRLSDSKNNSSSKNQSSQTSELSFAPSGRPYKINNRPQPSSLRSRDLPNLGKNRNQSNNPQPRTSRITTTTQRPRKNNEQSRNDSPSISRRNPNTSSSSNSRNRNVNPNSQRSSQSTRSTFDISSRSNIQGVRRTKPVPLQQSRTNSRPSNRIPTTKAPARLSNLSPFRPIVLSTSAKVSSKNNRNESSHDDEMKRRNESRFTHTSSPLIESGIRAASEKSNASNPTSSKVTRVNSGSKLKEDLAKSQNQNFKQSSKFKISSAVTEKNLEESNLVEAVEERSNVSSKPNQKLKKLTENNGSNNIAKSINNSKPVEASSLTQNNLKSNNSKIQSVSVDSRLPHTSIKQQVSSAFEGTQVSNNSTKNATNKRVQPNNHTPSDTNVSNNASSQNKQKPKHPPATITYAQLRSGSSSLNTSSDSAPIGNRMQSRTPNNTTPTPKFRPIFSPRRPSSGLPSINSTRNNPSPPKLPESKDMSETSSNPSQATGLDRASSRDKSNKSSKNTASGGPPVAVGRTPQRLVRPSKKPTPTASRSSLNIDIWKYPPRRPNPLYPQPPADVPAQPCDRNACKIPDCSCGGKDVPGNIPPQKVPQMVLLTFDDSVNDLNKKLYVELFEKGRVNPNGCPISATFYISHEWTDYAQVQNLYSDGHEIASHSITHSFGEQFSTKKWAQEIGGQREIMSAYGGVRMEDIRGMRAPFLAVGGNNMFRMLYDLNFTYDSSMPVYENNPPSWPYTLDYKLFHDCMIPPCPKNSYPGLWEVPMVMWQDLTGGRCSMADACTTPPDAEGIYKMLIKNFERHYTTNRSPFGLFYHAAWFTTPFHKEGFMAFLDTITAMDDVWLVTNWQALQWVRDPTPLSQAKSFPPFQCDYPERPPRCTSPRVCNVWHKGSVRYMKTCHSCPESYPWTGNTGIQSPLNN